MSTPTITPELVNYAQEESETQNKKNKVMNQSCKYESQRLATTATTRLAVRVVVGSGTKEVLALLNVTT